MKHMFQSLFVPHKLLLREGVRPEPAQQHLHFEHSMHIPFHQGLQQHHQSIIKDDMLLSELYPPGLAQTEDHTRPAVDPRLMVQAYCNSRLTEDAALLQAEAAERTHLQ